MAVLLEVRVVTSKDEVDLLIDQYTSQVHVSSEPFPVTQGNSVDPDNYSPRYRS